MQASGGRKTRTGSRLFLIYAIASLVPVLLLAAVLSHGYRQETQDRALAQGRAQAAVIEQMAIAPVLAPHDLGEGVRARERRRLLEATELSIFSGSVVRLRLRSFTGGIVFSDDGSTAGALPATDVAFRTAARGDKHVEIVHDPTGAEEQVIRVLQPIVPNASGQATGVLELYLPYAPIAAQLEAQLHRTYLRMAAGLAALYLVLALISWSSTRSLRRHAAEREHRALHDPLTDLPNREWFRLRAEVALRAEPGAIVLVDLDRFKEVNDTLGHHAGDELLRVVARRLRSSLRSDDAVARLGGDEFGLILPNLRDAAQALELLGRVRDELAADIALESLSVGVEASFGVAFYPEHGAGVEELLKRADAAMYQGKRGTVGVVIYDASEVAPSSSQSLLMQGELRHALARDELVLHYQPKIALDTGRTYGVEALLRWQHPERGLLAPGEFLPAIERSGLIEPLTAWVLARALEDRQGWLAAGADWPVSVNISARNLESPEFAELVISQLAEAGMAPGDLWLEVTETALAADANVAARVLGTLTDHGVKVSIDDFGMGYSCLAQLRSLAVDEIKVDRTFVSGLDHSAEDRSIVRSIVDLGHGLGCIVTAEGVETPAADAWLRAAWCDAAQGYRYARPAPWTELLNGFRDEPNVTALEPTTT
jgi:diguanylate cyclase (GGDEF)-like protein